MKKILFLSFIASFLLTPSAHAKVGSAQLAVDIPAGQKKTVRLKNLPKNAAVKVEVQSDGAVKLFFVDQEKYEMYPNIKRPLFQSQVQGKLSFTVKIPAAGHYYLLFDNVSDTRPVQLDVVIHGASGTDSSLLDKSTPAEQEKLIEENLSKVESQLKKIFIYKPFPMGAEFCGTEGPFRKSNGILLCMEYVKRINRSADSTEKATNIILFDIFHEVSRIFLSQWGHPSSKSEEVVDEFTVLLILMSGEPERLRPVIEHFRANRSSVQRARNIVRWLNNPERFKSWQTVVVPHMQTRLLEQLKQKPPTWISRDVIVKELLTRKATPL